MCLQTLQNTTPLEVSLDNGHNEVNINVVKKHFELTMILNLI